MEELTIIEKAKAYDKVVNKLKGFMIQGVDPLITRADVQDFFPELKESEKWIPKEIIKYLKEKGDFRSCWLAWLEKQSKQKPAEWSEEDKKKLNRIYMLLAEAADEHAYSTTCRLIGDKECVELQDFLKSLLPQNQWKPSDEQINTLEYYMHTLVCNEHKEILFGLYADLKKLREE